MMNSSKAFKETKLDHRLTGASNIDEQLQDVLKYVFRDYIEIWHKEISEDGEFLVELRKIFNTAISNFASRSVFFVSYIWRRGWSVDLSLVSRLSENRNSCVLVLFVINLFCF